MGTPQDMVGLLPPGGLGAAGAGDPRCRVLAAENIAGTIRAWLLFAGLQTYAGE